MNKLAFPALLVLIVGVMIGIFLIANKSAAPVNKTAEDNTRIGTKHEDQGQKHLGPGETNDKYNSNLPSSGDHAQAPAPWGVKDSEIPNETFVHNLEHGGVVIAYKPDLPEDQVKRLEEIFNKLPKSQQFGTIKALLIPRAQNDKPVQLAAWTYTLNLDGIDEAQITAFYRSHVDKGPELVP